VDLVRRLAASHLQRHKSSPRVFIFPGIAGIGRRTFAAYYLRNGLGGQANLPFGPQIPLSAQAELVDLYRALRVEIDPGIPIAKLTADQEAFIALPESEQIGEIIRAVSHFSRLGQAVTIVSAAGFFEDVANPKSWVKPLFEAIPEDQILIIVTNIQFRNEYIEDLSNAVQMRVEELHNEDIRTLMIFTAKLIGLDGFKVSDQLLRAIGGHPDVANAAVRLARQKGTAILERDPRQLFNIQRSIIGDAVRQDALKHPERLVLDVLGWLPTLGSDLLEKIIVGEIGLSLDEFISAVEGLILGCLIYATGYRLSIAASVRQLYRRYNVTEQTTLAAMAKVFDREWKQASDDGFRDDLFSAFVFMHLLEGKSVPSELRRLLTPSNLHEAVRDAYARGRQTENTATIQQAIGWGKLAFEMSMSDSIREEILSIVARAQIRLDQYSEAAATIDIVRNLGYRSVTFLEGHLLRKRRRFDEAIPKLRFVLQRNRNNRAAVHELALCYRRLHKGRELEELLQQYKDVIDDSAMFLDFIIALNISRGELQSIPPAIERLRQLDDSPNRADLRHAQLLSKQGNDKGAFEYLSDALAGTARGSLRLRAARAIAATKIGRFGEAREDLALVRSVDKDGARADSIETKILLAEGRRREAYELNQKSTPQEPGDWLSRAMVFEALANDPATLVTDSISMKSEAGEIRARYGADLYYVFES
jgi:tetratricopeptide (TPR) repeat protein